MGEQLYKVGYTSGCERDAAAALRERGIPYDPARNNWPYFIVRISQDRADELRGLTGVGPVLPITTDQERSFLVGKCDLLDN